MSCSKFHLIRAGYPIKRRCISVFHHLLCHPGGRGGPLPYGRGRDARRLAQGYTFRILVFLRVIWGKCHYIISRKGLFLGLHGKKYKKLCIFNSFYSIFSCNQSLKWSLQGKNEKSEDYSKAESSDFSFLFFIFRLISSLFQRSNVYNQQDLRPRFLQLIFSCPDWSSVRFNSKFPTSVPAPFLRESPLRALSSQGDQKRESKDCCPNASECS